MAYVSARMARCSMIFRHVDTKDFVIVDGIKYKGTSGLYELTFKRISDDTIYTENDKLG